MRIDGGSGGTGTRDIVITEFDTAAYGGIIRYDSVADLFTFGTLENSVVQYALNVARGTGNVGVGYSSINSTVKLAVAGTTLINTNSLTGTASQPLQVSGGAYVSGRVGVAITNPVGTFQIGTGTTTFIVTNSGSTSLVGLGTTNPQYILTVTDTGTPATTGLTNCLADFTTTANSYGQINLRNTSSGTNASSDIIITADNGTDSSNFIDLGINNSGFSVGSWTINGPTDGYLYTSDTNLSIGVAAANKYLSFFTGGTLISNERMRINATGVGIGTTNPLYKLDVAGDLNFNGNLYQNGSQFTSGIGIGSTSINPGSGVISPQVRIGVGFTDINFVGTGLSITGYGSTVVIDLGSSAIISETAPSNVKNGDLWWDSTYGVLKIYYNDSNSSQWVDANSGFSINYWIGTNVGIHTTVNVGIGTTIATEKLQVDGYLSIDGNVSYGTTIASTSSTSQVGIHSGLPIATYRSVEYTIQATQGTNFHTTKIIALHDGSLAYPTEYGSVFNTAAVATYDVDVSGGNIRLLATPASSSTTTYKIVFDAIKV